MPKAHADGTVTNAGLELEAAPAGRMTVAEYLKPPPPAEPESEGGEPSSPPEAGTDSSRSSKRRRTSATTNAAGSPRPARTAENR